MSGRSKYELARAIVVASGGTPKPADSFHNFLEKWLVQEGGAPKPHDSQNDLLRKLCVARGETPHPIDSNNDLLRHMSGLGAGCMNTEHLEAILDLIESGSPPPPAAPAAPSGLTYTSTAVNAIELEWVDNATDETGYRVERSSDGLVFDPFENLPAGTESYVDASVSGDNVYYYRVVAIGAEADSSPSNVLQVGTPPVAPSLFQLGSQGGGLAAFSWQDNSSSESGFRLYGANVPQLESASLQASYGANVEGSGDVTHSPSLFNDGDSYFYYVTAFNSWGETASNVASFEYSV